MTGRANTLHPVARTSQGSTSLAVDASVAGDLACELLASGSPPLIRVRGVSMEPTIHDGDCVGLEPIGDRGARVGEIVAFRRGPCLCLHRVVRVLGEGVPAGYVTAGDGLLADDGAQAASLMLGRVAFVRTPTREWVPSSWSRRVHGLWRAQLSLHPRVRASLRVIRDAVAPKRHRARETREAGPVT